MFLKYFEDCSPGGDLYATNTYLSKNLPKKVEADAAPQFTDDEWDFFVLILRNLEDPTALDALRQLALEERGVDFDKVLLRAKKANHDLQNTA